MNTFSFQRPVDRETYNAYFATQRSMTETLQFILIHDAPWEAIESDGRLVTVQPQKSLHTLLGLYYSRLHFRVVNPNPPEVWG